MKMHAFVKLANSSRRNWHGRYKDLSIAFPDQRDSRQSSRTRSITVCISLQGFEIQRNRFDVNGARMKLGYRREGC